MDYASVFRDEYLNTQDLVTFVGVLHLFNTHLNQNQCWCIKEINHPAMKNFTASHPSQPRFKGRDARVLSLALTDQFYADEKPVIIRRHCCTSNHCINPGHYFYGTRSEVQMEKQKKNGIKMSLNLISEIRLKRQVDPRRWTYQALSRHYDLPRHTVSRICRRQSYDI